MTIRLGALEADSARFVMELADGVRIYAVATKTGELCVLAERLPNNNGKNDAAAMGCGSPLTQSQPTTVASFQANEGDAVRSVTASLSTASPLFRLWQVDRK